MTTSPMNPESIDNSTPNDQSDTLAFLPPPWLRIHQEFMTRFLRATGENRQGWCLVTLEKGLPVPTTSGDDVLDGIARKSSQVMAVTCRVCAKPARRRRHIGRVQVQCASCYGKAKLLEEIQSLIQECPRPNDRPSADKPVAWHEHELPARLRHAIPEALWRRSSPPGVDPVRYVGAADLLRLEPWLQHLVEALQREINTPP